MTKKQTNSVWTGFDWTGINGKIGARLFNSSLRKLEMLLMGDYGTVFFNEVSSIIKGNEVVLDIGSGSGYFSLEIAKKLNAGKVICLDLSEIMLQYLEHKAEKKGLKHRIQILKAEASSSGLEDESVDLVVSNFVFHEISSPETVLREILRVLKPNGWIIITDFRDTRIGKIIGALHRKEAHGPFSVNELNILFTKAGLNNVKAFSVRHWVIGVGKK